MALFWNHVKLPKRKKTKIEKIGESLPILVSNKICRGEFREEKVLVFDKEDIQHLYCNGFFGKGLQSKGPPKQLSSLFFNNNINNIKSENNKHTNDSDDNNSDMSIDDNEDDMSFDDDNKINNKNIKNTFTHDKTDDANDISDNDDFNDVNNKDADININDDVDRNNNDDDDKNTNVDDSIEPLVLSHYEAFFLSFALGCLMVFDPDDNQLSIKAQWKLYSQSKPFFGHYYSAYHYFRSQGWVVRSGLKYAGDFVLYKQGPLFYHSSFNVLLCPVINNSINNNNDENNTRNNNNNNNSNNDIEWTDLIGLNRITEQVSKNLLLVHTFEESTRPPSLPNSSSSSSFSSFIGPLLPSSSSSPSFISIKEALAIRIEVLLIKRWAPNKEREQ